jgi:hypothetical protein
MHSIKSKICWICGINIADSSEHKYKNSTIDNGGYWIFKRDDKPEYIQGKNSKQFKYNYVICHQCNTSRSQPWDRAFDKLFAMSKGEILSNISAKHVNKLGIKKVISCITWEQIGTFQITYWLNIKVNIVYGSSIKCNIRNYTLNYLNNLVYADVRNSFNSWLYKENYKQ